MPRIVINEYDNTTAGNTSYSNFAVLVPGFVETGKGTKGFDENGVAILKSVTDFEDIVGTVTSAGVAKIRDLRASVSQVVSQSDVTSADAETEDSGVTSTPVAGASGDLIAHYGNQMAKELLALGYTVLYKKIKTVDELKNYNNFWKALEDRAVYEFRYVVTGLISGTGTLAVEAANYISQLASLANYGVASAEELNENKGGRDDIIALVDMDSKYYAGQTQVTAIDSLKTAAKGTYTDCDKFSALLAPYVTFAETAFSSEYNNTTLPASFYYLACAAKAFTKYNEWYAVAGYERGVCKYTVSSTGCTFGDAAINALQPRFSADPNEKAINLITKIKNNYYLWGNRTAAGLTDALYARHFLNIRQLCITIKKQIYVACKKFMFDPNSDILWTNFCDCIRPTLEKMKTDQGIADYKFMKVKTGLKGVLKAKIRIVPIEAVEDFVIGVSLEDSLEGNITLTFIDEE